MSITNEVGGIKKRDVDSYILRVLYKYQSSCEDKVTKHVPECENVRRNIFMLFKGLYSILCPVDRASRYNLSK